MVWTGIITGTFLADTLLKSWAEKHLSEKAVREVAGDKIILRKLHNSGVACNVGEKKPELVKIGTLVLWTSLFAVYLKMLTKPGKNAAKFGGALALGGGLSNLNDRITKGYVTDYFSLNVKWDKLRRLVFNISDFFILFGTGIAMLGQLGRKSDERDSDEIL